MFISRLPKDNGMCKTFNDSIRFDLSIYIKTQAKNISDQTTEGGPEGKFNEMVAVLIVGMSCLGLSVLH